MLLFLCVRQLSAFIQNSLPDSEGLFYLSVSNIQPQVLHLFIRTVGELISQGSQSNNNKDKS